jgi:hypothetical protein
MRKALMTLRLAGCTTVYMDGSYVTDKSDPSDYDGCWDSAGVNLGLLDPVFKDFSNGRAAQKLKYCAAQAESGLGWLKG